MIDEPRLSQLLEFLADGMNALDKGQSALLIEVAALRDTMKELGGEHFASAFQAHQLRLMGQNLEAEKLARLIAEMRVLKARTVVIPEP